MKFTALFLSLALSGHLAAATVPAVATPLFGFVTVTGDDGGDDAGPDPRVVGEALKYSGATAIRATKEEAAYFPLLGRLGAGYAHRGTKASDIQYFNSLGYTNFIFENEPDGRNDPNWATDYMNALSAFYPLMKGVGSSNKVIGGNLFTQSLNLLYDRNFKNVSDYIGYHNYSDDPATGINIGEAGYVHGVAVARGDGNKKIFFGEGWGPKREIAGLKRLFPDAEISAAEISTLRNFVVNGYWNLVTQTGSYDPNWVLGALFFTSNDNWGGRHWADRAVPEYDGQGNIVSYRVDGYSVGLDIFPHFYNGGILDIYGNAKDNIWDIFPGAGLAVNNSGFEYYNLLTPAVASDWTANVGGAPAANFSIDASVRHGGQLSQRLNLTSTGQLSVSTDTVKASVAQGQVITLTAWVKTWNVVKGGDRGAAIKLDFLNSSGNLIGFGTWPAGLEGTRDWTKLTVSAAAPSGATKVRATCALYGTSGRAWFDDVEVSLAGAGASTLRGYVLDSNRQALPGATVTTTSGGFTGATDNNGYFTISGVEPGVYDVTASKAGYSAQTVKAQVALPGKNRVLGYQIPAASSSLPSGVTVTDPAIGGTLKISWTNPAGPFDCIRIYRSSDPAQLGSLAYDNVQSSPLWDTGLSDGVKYSYTVRAVKNGIETTNKDRTYGVPTGGINVQTYSNYGPAIFNHWAADYGQTFKATQTGSISSASCTPGFGGGGGTNLTFSIRAGGPTGTQIGPSRTKAGSGDSECTVTWNPGEIPVVQGQTYYLSVVGAGGFAAYRSGNIYPNGQMYMNGSPMSDQSSDLWSTITIVQQSGVRIFDIKAKRTGPGSVTVSWQTSAPSTGQVEYGTTESYGSLSATHSTLSDSHSITLSNLLPETEYHFRTLSNRPNSPDSLSLDYTFTTSAAILVTDAAEAKACPDGTRLTMNGVVSASFSGYFYLQGPSSTCGIRVEQPEHGLSTGAAVSVTGALATNADGERFIQASDSQTGGMDIVLPLHIGNRAIGGENAQYDAGSGAGQQGVTGGVGLNNIGLLVTTWGTVTGSGSGYFYIDDGSGLEDASGLRGLRVVTNGASSPATGKMARVTGPVSCFRNSGGVQRRVLLRSPVDVTLLNP
ncbi:MAG: carboxypeptidase regulatory-like domain-containing protein [Armatimonadetes bacterium]|nr:carboxypeptidase regulatory-like domain-containing protein [Armatimonadota bacterium]